MNPKFEILTGLPGTGPTPEGFSATGTGMHREGLVVRFILTETEWWVGNFQPGSGGTTVIVPYSDGKHILVVASGQAYVVDPVSKKAVREFGGDIQQVIELPEKDALLVGNGLWLERIDRDGNRTWRTKRISWDGMRNLQMMKGTINGEAYTPMGDEWIQFSVNLSNGWLEGGSYNGPDS